jgi:hypothetical protein
MVVEEQGRQMCFSENQLRCLAAGLAELTVLDGA